MIGQANLCFAQGRIAEALEMMEEVLRQKPKNPEPYQCLASLFEDMGDRERQLQCGLLAAYLDYLTPAHQWVSLAQVARELGKDEQALACYSKAIRAEPSNWSNYAERINLLDQMGEDTRRAMTTKVLAVKGMKDTDDFQWYDKFARDTAQQILTLNNSSDYSDAIVCWRCLLEKGRALGMLAVDVLEQLVEAYIFHNQMTEAAKAIFQFSGLKAYDCEGAPIVPETGGWSEEPMVFPPLTLSRYETTPDFPEKLKIKLAVCWILLSRMDLAQPMVKELLGGERELSVDLLEIGHALAEKGMDYQAESFLLNLLEHGGLSKQPSVWLAYAEVLSKQRKIDEACEAYGKVIEIAPGDVDARVSLAALQQGMGRADQALETLSQTPATPERFDVGEVEFKDERLLHKECMIVYSQKKWERFLKLAYRILAPYFYDLYAVKEKHISARNLYRDKVGQRRLSLHVRRVSLEVSRDTLMERLVKKVGRALGQASMQKKKAVKQLLALDLYELSFKVCEVLFDQQRYEELTQVAGYCANMPSLVLADMAKTFSQLMLLGALKSGNAKAGFTILHNCFGEMDRPRLWNLYGLVFIMSQDVNFHRIILRAAAKNPECTALTILSGNNSLVSGTYQHALSEYLMVLDEYPSDPLVNLLTGLTCVHLACKKDIARRHDICLQGFAFLNQYEKLRGECQETYYNLGRAMQQTNLLFAAMHYYRKVLECDPIVAWAEDTGSEGSPKTYDLRPMAAHNMAVMYQNSGNWLAARDMYERYCKV